MHRLLSLATAALAWLCQSVSQSARWSGWLHGKRALLRQHKRIVHASHYFTFLSLPRFSYSVKRFSPSHCAIHLAFHFRSFLYFIFQFLALALLCVLTLFPGLSLELRIWVIIVAIIIFCHRSGASVAWTTYIASKLPDWLRFIGVH